MPSGVTGSVGVNGTIGSPGTGSTVKGIATPTLHTTRSINSTTTDMGMDSGGALYLSASSV